MMLLKKYTNLLMLACFLLVSLSLSALEYDVYLTKGEQLIAVPSDFGELHYPGLVTFEELLEKYPGNVFLVDTILKEIKLAKGDVLRLHIKQDGLADSLLGIFYATHKDWHFLQKDVVLTSHDVDDLGIFEYTFPLVIKEPIIDGGSASSSSGEPVYEIYQLVPFQMWFEKQPDDVRKKVSTVMNDLRYKQTPHNNRIEPCKNRHGASVFEVKSRSDEGRRVYFTVVGQRIYLLDAGNKNTDQDADIDRAAKLAAQLEKEYEQVKKERRAVEKQALKDGYKKLVR
jgi:putative component of toxin-antitoxin plasmid stabilization module